MIIERQPKSQSRTLTDKICTINYCSLLPTTACTLMLHLKLFHAFITSFSHLYVYRLSLSSYVRSDVSQLRKFFKRLSLRRSMNLSPFYTAVRKGRLWRSKWRKTFAVYKGQYETFLTNVSANYLSILSSLHIFPSLPCLAMSCRAIMSVTVFLFSNSCSAFSALISVSHATFRYRFEVLLGRQITNTETLSHWLSNNAYTIWFVTEMI